MPPSRLNVARMRRNPVLRGARERTWLIPRKDMLEAVEPRDLIGPHLDPFVGSVGRVLGARAQMDVHTDQVEEGLLVRAVWFDRRGDLKPGYLPPLFWNRWER